MEPLTLATPTRAERASYQYRHTLDALVDAQRAPQGSHGPHGPHTPQSHAHHLPCSHSHSRSLHHQHSNSSSHHYNRRQPSFTTAATPQHTNRQAVHRTPRTRESIGALAPDRRSSALRVAVHDITAILSVSIKVDGFQFDSSIMEHPEFLISTQVVFQCQQLGAKQLETSWRLYRTFAEFQGLDLQLRRKFSFDMGDIAPPRRHRRRTFFRLHRSPAFLTRRCAELNAYLAEVLDAPTMRLTRFADPRAPLILRCFCNFDVGFGKKLRVRPEQPDACVLCLDHIGLNSTVVDAVPVYPPSSPSSPPPPLPLTPANLSLLTTDSDDPQSQLQQLIQASDLDMIKRLRRNPSLLSAPRSDAPSKADSKLDELEANLLDDRARNLSMCLRYECACQNMSFHLTEGKMTRILRFHGLRPVYRPSDPDGPTALYCVLFRLQQHNALDQKLYELLSDSAPTSRDHSHATTSDESASLDDRDAEQLALGVELLREALANYALLHVHALQPHFRMGLVDLTKRFHEFKSRQQQRVGAMELVLLCSMLDLSIVLVTNDHDGTVQEIFPLPGLEPIRRGGRLLLSLGYILPTMVCVNGVYLLADTLKPDASAPPLRATMWQGLEEMDRCLVALIETHVMQSELRRIEQYDETLAETLNRAILDAVWNDCQHNPNLFNLFQRHARQFGKSRASAAQFFQYMEIAFGVDGATYLVDFLLYVLPEATLRKQLLRARWRRVQKRLTKRVSAAVAC